MLVPKQPLTVYESLKSVVSPISVPREVADVLVVSERQVSDGIWMSHREDMRSYFCKTDTDTCLI
jgi:hypothetical protein